MSFLYTMLKFVPKNYLIYNINFGEGYSYENVAKCEPDTKEKVKKLDKVIIKRCKNKLELM